MIGDDSVRDGPFTYEGRVYVRPIGRGIVLDDVPGEPHLDEWLEAQLAGRLGHRPIEGNWGTRVRLTVELLADSGATPRDPPEQPL